MSFQTLPGPGVKKEETNGKDKKGGERGKREEQTSAHKWFWKSTIEPSNNCRFHSGTILSPCGLARCTCQSLWVWVSGNWNWAKGKAEEKVKKKQGRGKKRNKEGKKTKKNQMVITRWWKHWQRRWIQTVIGRQTISQVRQLKFQNYSYFPNLGKKKKRAECLSSERENEVSPRVHSQWWAESTME